MLCALILICSRKKERAREKNAHIAIVNIYCSHNNNSRFLISPCVCCFVFFSFLLLLSEDRYNRISIDIDSLEKSGTSHYKTTQTSIDIYSVYIYIYIRKKKKKKRYNTDKSKMAGFLILQMITTTKNR
jgi:hypothetical protein